MEQARTLTERMADAARSLENEPGPQATMAAAVDLALACIGSADAAGITLVERDGQVTTPAYSSDLVLAGDLLQYELREGPCLDAIWDEPAIHSSDLAHEERWPTWAPRVARDLGARSMLCLRLFTDSRTLGALNLYALGPGAFDAHDLEEGIALAAHVAVAMAAAQQGAQLAHALDTRTVIGQATGILMERFGLDEAGAFRVLTRVSSQTNMRVRDLSRELVQTRHLDGLPDGQEVLPGQHV